MFGHSLPATVPPINSKPDNDDDDDFFALANSVMEKSNQLQSESDRVQMTLAEKNLQNTTNLLKTLAEAETESKEKAAQLNKRVGEMVDAVKAKRAKREILIADIAAIKYSLADAKDRSGVKPSARSEDVRVAVTACEDLRFKHKAISDNYYALHSLFSTNKIALENNIASLESKTEQGRASLSTAEPVAITKHLFSPNSKS